MALLLVFLVIECSPRIGQLVADYLLYSVLDIENAGVSLWGSVHHLTQGIFPLVLMMLWPGGSLENWGFRMGEKKEGIKWVTGFTVVWTMLYMLLTTITIFSGGQPVAYYDVSSANTLLAELSYRFFIVGTSEEILFRAFPLTLLILYWDKKIDVFRFQVSVAGFITAGFFAYAHLKYRLFPLEIHHFDPVQMFTAFGLGLFYALVYERTKSILYPVLIHSISDVIPVLSLWTISQF